ncbi:MAG: NADH-quinone oxidoreductase subunit C [Desulfarculus sp.]|nr:NADH-quinone oxidoreductase subunit C [Desulfarculus sp.]
MTSEHEARIIAQLGDIQAWCKAQGDYAKSGHHASFFLEAGQLMPAARLLFDQGYFLESIAGVDVTEGIMLVYHLNRYDRSERVALRLLVPQEDKKAPSIVSVYSGANWHERECYDFFGVVFEGHPELKHPLLPDDLGVNPLVKEQGRKSLHSMLPLGQLVDSKP